MSSISDSGMASGTFSAAAIRRARAMSAFVIS
jgi:hypothetical protein